MKTNKNTEVQIQDSGMVAIRTRYFGPGNVRGSRIEARAGRHRAIESYDYSLTSEQNHISAAKALARKAGWDGKMVGGTIETSDRSDGMVFVFVDAYV